MNKVEILWTCKKCKSIILDMLDTNNLIFDQKEDTSFVEVNCTFCGKNYIITLIKLDERVSVLHQ
jgi:RNase P subunit RPR2